MEVNLVLSQIICSRKQISHFKGFTSEKPIRLANSESMPLIRKTGNSCRAESHFNYYVFCPDESSNIEVEQQSVEVAQDIERDDPQLKIPENWQPTNIATECF